MNIFSRYSPLFSSITPPTRTLFLIVLLMLAENGLALLTPWLAGLLTQSLLSETISIALSFRQIIAILFIVISLQSILTFSNRILSGATGERMLVQIRTRLYNHLQRLPLSYHYDHKHGETLALITNDCSAISNFISGTVVSLIPTLLTAVGAILCIGFISPKVAILAVTLIPLFYIAIKLLGRKVRPVARRLMDHYAATISLAEENLSILSTIKIYVREKFETTRFKDSNEKLFTISYQYLVTQARLAPSIKLLATSIILIIVLIIGSDFSSGVISASDIVSLVLYGLLLTQPISRLADTYGQIQRTASAADRLLEVLQHEAEDLDNGKQLPSIRGAITIHKLCFSYPGRDQLLHNLDLLIAPGETLAITGENGAGKSTLAHLLMRFNSPDSGKISIDGFDIQKVSLTSLRKQIGLVEQIVLLQNSTVAENIRFGKPEATLRDIETAAVSANAIDFIRNLPLGFDTIIGDQGIKLSGGQKQRIALARALITDPAILILDEATAMFDPEGELAFIESNKKLLNSRTVIIITHRPASLALADRILRLENGVFTLDHRSPVA